MPSTTAAQPAAPYPAGYADMPEWQRVTSIARAPYVGAAAARRIAGPDAHLEVRPWDGRDRFNPINGDPVAPILALDNLGLDPHEIVDDAGVFLAWLHPEEAAAYIGRLLDALRAPVAQR